MYRKRHLLEVELEDSQFVVLLVVRIILNGGLATLVVAFSQACSIRGAAWDQGIPLLAKSLPLGAIVAGESIVVPASFRAVCPVSGVRWRVTKQPEQG